MTLIQATIFWITLPTKETPQEARAKRWQVRLQLSAFAFCCCDKYQDQKLLERKGVYIYRLYSSSSEEAKAGTKGTSLKQQLLIGLLPLACSTIIFSIQAHLPRDGTVYSRPFSTNKQFEKFPQTWSQTHLIWKVLQLWFSLPRWL